VVEADPVEANTDAAVQGASLAAARIGVDGIKTEIHPIRPDPLPRGATRSSKSARLTRRARPAFGNQARRNRARDGDLIGNQQAGRLPIAKAQAVKIAGAAQLR
jgi:hypothetical protein